jgi:hypothetical protein
MEGLEKLGGFMAKRLYLRRVLGEMGPQRWFGREATQAAFLLGGIGTGNVSLGSRGDLRDWEIFNRSAKGQKLPYSFFSMAVVKGDGKPDARVLEGRLVPPFAESHGFHPNTAAGLPHISDSRLMGEYPFAYVKFEDETLPVEVSLEAYTPFIPHEPDESGLPAAVLTYRVRNTGGEPVEVTVAGSLMNAVGYTGLDEFDRVRADGLGGNINEYRDEEHGPRHHESAGHLQEALTKGRLVGQPPRVLGRPVRRRPPHGPRLLGALGGGQHGRREHRRRRIHRAGRVEGVQVHPLVVLPEQGQELEPEALIAWRLRLRDGEEQVRGQVRRRMVRRQVPNIKLRASGLHDPELPRRPLRLHPPGPRPRRHLSQHHRHQEQHMLLARGRLLLRLRGMLRRRRLLQRQLHPRLELRTDPRLSSRA